MLLLLLPITLIVLNITFSHFANITLSPLNSFYLVTVKQ